MKEVFGEIEKIGIVPVIKLKDTSKAVELATALRMGGINCAEVTFRAAGASTVIRKMLEKYPDMIVGAGTVLTCEQVDAAVMAGAKFCVAPALNVELIRHCLALKVPFIPGVMTPTEVDTAINLGLSHVKFFPAEAAGGLAFIKAICAPYSGIKFMPTGGINDKNLATYIAYNRIFACGGSWMVKESLLDQGDWNEVTAQCKLAVDIIRNARSL